MAQVGKIVQEQGDMAQVGSPGAGGHGTGR